MVDLEAEILIGFSHAINQQKQSTIMTGIEKTREEVIDVMYRVMAISRKASCRQLNYDIAGRLANVANVLGCIDHDLAHIIGD